jgi:hypothetical protein
MRSLVWSGAIVSSVNRDGNLGHVDPVFEGALASQSGADSEIDQQSNPVVRGQQGSSETRCDDLPGTRGFVGCVAAHDHLVHVQDPVERVA